MRILQGSAAGKMVARLAARSQPVARQERKVKALIAEVRKRGDPALRDFARRWDGLGKKALRITGAEIRKAARSISIELGSSVRLAAQNIRSFAENQRPLAWTRTKNGLTLGQRVRPLDAVGCYVPGGRYPLLSTLLMTAIPAQVAGVARICVVSPHPSD